MIRILLAACLFVVSCSSDGTGLLSPVPPNVLSSPYTITVSGTTIGVGASITASPRIELSAFLGARDMQSWPAGATTGRVWVIRQGVAWSAITQPDPRALPLPFGTIAVVAGPGPSWPAGDSVDVVIEVRDANGSKQLLRAPRTVIISTS
jgi:hypothetical protein